MGNELTDIQIFERTLNDSYRIQYMDDGTVNMGSSFDIFDVVSHYDNPYIFDEHRSNREYLKTIMELVGFVAYDQEWWHFRLRNEPYPTTYFDFDMFESSNGGSLLKAEVTLSFITGIIVWFQKQEF